MRPLQKSRNIVNSLTQLSKTPIFSLMVTKLENRNSETVFYEVLSYNSLVKVA